MHDFILESADYGNSTGQVALVKITMRVEGKLRTALGEDRRGIDSSPFEAARKAIRNLTDFYPEVQSVVGRVGGGKDPESTVYLAIKKHGRRVIGQASRSNSFVAEIAAYVDAINNLDEDTFC